MNYKELSLYHSKVVAHISRTKNEIAQIQNKTISSHQSTRKVQFNPSYCAIKSKTWNKVFHARIINKRAFKRDLPCTWAGNAPQKWPLTACWPRRDPRSDVNPFHALRSLASNDLWPSHVLPSHAAACSAAQCFPNHSRSSLANCQRTGHLREYIYLAPSLHLPFFFLHPSARALSLAVKLWAEPRFLLVANYFVTASSGLRIGREFLATYITGLCLLQNASSLSNEAEAMQPFFFSLSFWLSARCWGRDSSMLRDHLVSLSLCFYCNWSHAVYS